MAAEWNQDQNIENENLILLSSDQVNPRSCRKNQRRKSVVRNEEYEDYTTDNNETNH